MQSKYACLALVAPMTVVLHGCGGGGGTTTSAPAPTTPAPAPTPPPAPVVTPTPWSPDKAVEILNWLYMDFDENDDATHVGVTISMAADRTTFNNNIFCEPVMGTQCHNGQSDCRMSASLFNHKMMVDGNRLAPTMSRPIGYLFNQNLTEQHYGKCAYIWDGADSNSLNNGCGLGAMGNSCGDHRSGFWNQCNQQAQDGSQPHNCTRQDPEVSGRLCKCEAPICTESYGVIDPPTDMSGATCFYELPGLVYGDPTTTNHLRDAVKQRVHNQGNDTEKTPLWNEVVIDNRLLIPKVQTDPTDAIWAFVCVISSEFPTACAEATAMRDEFQTAYNVTKGQVPVIGMTTEDFTTSGGPFTLPRKPTAQIIA